MKIDNDDIVDGRLTEEVKEQEEKCDESKTQALLEDKVSKFDLIKKDPKFLYLTDVNDFRNIACEAIGCTWRDFSEAITNAIKNRINDAADYPTALLNNDGSVSFLFSHESKDYKQLEEFLKQEYVATQFEFYTIKNGFELKGEKVMEVIVNDDVTKTTECRFNLSADELHDIMMLNYQYRGYRNENSITKLNKDFSMKEGMIRLFPISKEKSVIGYKESFCKGNETIVEEREAEAYSVGVAGCQTYEIPSIQLMRLLPNYESEIAPERKKNGGYFHWVPQEVERALTLHWNDLRLVLKKIFSDNGIALVERQEKEFYQEPEFLVVEDAAKQRDVRLAELDEEAKDFYALYGVLPRKQLDGYQSVEVDSLAFLKAIKHVLSERKKTYFSAEDVSKAISNIDLMISKETERRPSTDVQDGHSEPLDQNLGTSVTCGCTIS